MLLQRRRRGGPGRAGRLRHRPDLPPVRQGGLRGVRLRLADLLRPRLPEGGFIRRVQLLVLQEEAEPGRHLLQVLLPGDRARQEAGQVQPGLGGLREFVRGGRQGSEVAAYLFRYELKKKGSV